MKSYKERKEKSLMVEKKREFSAVIFMERKILICIP